MKEAIIATHNPGKVKEFKEILEPRGYDVKSLAEIGFTEEIEETGHTFEENAILKAEAVAKAVNKMVIADDSVYPSIILAADPVFIQPAMQGNRKTTRQISKSAQRAERYRKRTAHRPFPLRTGREYSR